ncbi:ABC transporter substrate-binding protein, partial [Pseudomonas palleroniana]
MSRRPPRKTPFHGRLTLALCLAFAGWLATIEARAAEILLTGAEDS